MRKKKSLAEHLLEWAAEREGPLVRFAKRQPLLGKLLKEYGIRTLNRDECMGSFRNDLVTATNEVLIYCPFINSVDVTRFINMTELKDALNRGIKVKIITRPPKKEDSKTIDKLRKVGISVYLREGFHEKVITIDDEIAYVGSANILAWPSGSDIMQRVEDLDTVKEVLAKIALPKDEEMF